jgi:putative transposase
MKALTSKNGTVPATAAQADEAADVPAPRRPPQELMGDGLLERSLDETGGLRLTGGGSMLGKLVQAVLERAPEAEMAAHLGCERGASAAAGTWPT